MGDWLAWTVVCVEWVGAMEEDSQTIMVWINFVKIDSNLNWELKKKNISVDVT